MPLHLTMIFENQHWVAEAAASALA